MALLPSKMVSFPNVHLPWNNGFLNGEPLLFKCHVLCCAGIDDPMIHHMIISTQGGNKHLFLIFTSLVCFFFLITLLLQTISHKMSRFFVIKTKLFICFMSFVKQCNIFRIFTYFSFGNLMKESSNDKLKVNILVDMDSKLMTKLSKDGGRLMRSNMYTFSSSIFTSMEHN